MVLVTLREGVGGGEGEDNCGRNRTQLVMTCMVLVTLREGGGEDSCGRNRTQLVVTLNGCWSTLVKTQLVMKCIGIGQCFRGTKPACSDVRLVLTNACGKTQLVVTSDVPGSMLVEKHSLW